jgi:IclR family transcriptional regulator, KDG regulon repressor
MAAVFTVACLAKLLPCSIYHVPVLSTDVSHNGTGQLSTLGNAASILRLFTPDRLEISVTDVSKMLGIPKSSASRLLKAMLQQGLLARHENSPRYKVGNLLFEVSQLYRLNSSLIELTDDVLKAICRETGHTGYVSILDGADVLVIRMHQGSHALRVFTPLGQRAPAFATANGRTLLARLSEDEVRAIHADGLGIPSPNSPQSIDELLAALVNVRRKGWEEADDEAIPGVGSISVSVADPKVRESIGFCISYSGSNMGTEEKNRIVALLTAAAHRIAARFDDPFFSHLMHVVPAAGSVAA